MIKSFFDTKICDIVKEDFWKGYSEKNIWTDRNMIFDLFPKAAPDFTVADILKMLKKENKNYDGKDLSKTAMLLFWLSVAVTYSENDNVKKFRNQSIDKYFSFLHKKCPEATGRTGYFEDKRRECLCFIDDCFQYERNSGYGSADEYEKIDNTTGSAIAVSVSILSKPEFYYDENLFDKNDYLISNAEQCLSDIIYAPFFYAYEKL